MSFVSHLYREGSPEVVVPIPTTAPVKQESEQEMAAVFPEVVATAQEKQGFESLVGRIFLHREGDSTAKSWAVRVLAVLLLPFTVLTTIFDAGRFAAYKAGLINGQSYSLIDMTSNSCQSAVAKVNSVYNSYMHPVRTIEQENKETVKQMEKLSKELVETYKALNASHFSDSRALKAAQKIPELQECLINEINAYVRNASSPEEFNERLQTAREKVVEEITKAAGDRVYIANKIERRGPPSLLAGQIIAEFNKAFESNEATLSSTFSQIARQGGSEVVSSLKAGVEQGRLTEEQAGKAVEAHAVTLFNESLVEGLEMAGEVTKTFLKKATDEGLVNEVQASTASQKATADVPELAIAAAKDVARTSTEGTSDQEIDHQLIKAAEKLIEQGRLPKENESQFLTKAKDQVQVIRKQIKAERQALLQQEHEAREALELREAKAIRKVELVKQQGKLMDTFFGFFNVVRGKQDTLAKLHEEHAALSGALSHARNAYTNLQNGTIEVGGAKLRALEAAKIYSIEVNRISGLRVPDAERERLLNELVKQGFDQNTVEIIAQLNTFSQDQIIPIVKDMGDVSKQIIASREEVKELLKDYDVFKNNNINFLEKDQQRRVIDVEKQVLALDKKFDDLQAKDLRIPFVQRKNQRVPVETDPEFNRMRVEEILKKHNRPEFTPEAVISEAVTSKAVTEVDPEPRLFTKLMFYPLKKGTEVFNQLFGTTSKVGTTSKAEEDQPARSVLLES